MTRAHREKIGLRYERGFGALHGWRVVGAGLPFTSTDHAHGWWVARQLQREEHYDFVPYPDPDRAEKRNLWLLYREGQCIGGLLFTHYETTPEHAAVWELSWVWFAPVSRGRGTLSGLWPALRKQYGDFYVQCPLSRSMKAFLRRPGFGLRNFPRPVTWWGIA